AGRLEAARRAQAARDLHLVTERLRFLWDPDVVAPAVLRRLEAHCRTVWEAGGVLREGARPPADVEGRGQAGLPDLAVCCADLRRHLGAAREALQILAEAEALLGPSATLARERQTCAEVLGDAALAEQAARQAAQLQPRTAWEHYQLGRAFLRTGDL